MLFLLLAILNLLALAQHAVHKAYVGTSKLICFTKINSKRADNWGNFSIYLLFSSYLGCARTNAILF